MPNLTRIAWPKLKTRSITEQEIALIKAMLARGLKNKDIQFLFNRPDRPVNTGRISTIRSGSYSNSSQIIAASDEELETFLRSFDESCERHNRQKDRTNDCRKSKSLLSQVERRHVEP